MDPAERLRGLDGRVRSQHDLGPGVEQPAQRERAGAARANASETSRARAIAAMGFRLSMAALRIRRKATSSVSPNRAIRAPLAFSMTFRSSKDWRSACVSR